MAAVVAVGLHVVPREAMAGDGASSGFLEGTSTVCRELGRPSDLVNQCDQHRTVLSSFLSRMGISRENPG